MFVSDGVDDTVAGDVGASVVTVKKAVGWFEAPFPPREFLVLPLPPFPGCRLLALLVNGTIWVLLGGCCWFC